MLCCGQDSSTGADEIVGRDFLDRTSSAAELDAMHQVHMATTSSLYMAPHDVCVAALRLCALC